MIAKTKKEIDTLRESGRRLAVILNALVKEVKPGISAKELNDKALEMMYEEGDEPAFLNYQPYGASRPYPGALCVSINDEVVHGIPNESAKFLKRGDVVALDIGLSHRGLITDMAVTVAVGDTDEKGKTLMRATEESLAAGIAAARVGNTVGDIGAAIVRSLKPYGFGVVSELGGHGVGEKVHEEPYIPNVEAPGEGPKLKEGMVIAIEPIVNEGSAEVVLDKDGYTYHTKDGGRSAHFEHTILITREGPEILTKI